MINVLSIKRHLLLTFVLISIAQGYAQTLNLTKAIQGGATTSAIKTDGTSTFYYALNYSVSGANAVSPKIIDTLPEGVEFLGASASAGIIASTTNTTPDATKFQRLITVNLNASAATAGSSGQVLIQVRFAAGYAYNGYIATNKAEFRATGATTAISNSVSITATANDPNPTWTKTSSGSVVDDVITYYMQYTDPSNSTGAGGVYLKNAIFRDTLPPGAIFVDAALRCNNVISYSPFSTDFQYDPINNVVSFDYATATFQNSNVSFSGGANPYGRKVTPLFPSGCANGFYVRVRYPSGAGFAAGQTVVNRASLSGERVISNTPVTYSTSKSLVLTSPDCTGPTVDYNSYNVILQGDTAYINNRIFNNKSTSYSNVTVNFNYGALGLRPLFFTIVRPPSPSDSVSVYYNTNLNSNYQPLVLNLSQTWVDNDSSILVKNLGLSSGEYITNVRYEYTNVYPSDDIRNAIVVEDPIGLAFGTQNIPVSLSYECVSTPMMSNFNRSIIVVNNSDIRNYFSFYPVKTATPSAQIGNVITYTLTGTAGTASATISDMVVTDLLPANITFNAITSSRLYKAGLNSLGNWTVNNLSYIRPIPYTVIDNYNGTGRQLVRWDLSGIPISYIDTSGYAIVFTANVNPGASFPSVVNSTSVLSKSKFNEMGALTGAGYSITDVNDLDGDGNTTETGTAYNATTSIAAISALSASKRVQGSMDAVYTSNGNTVAGGIANYRLLVRNTGSVAMRDITLVDVLPYIGDKYLVSQTGKGSQWDPFLVGPVSAPAGVTVYYSTVADINGADVGVVGGSNAPNWSTTLPTPVTAVKAIKFEYAHDYPTNSLAAGDSLVLMWPMRVPAGVDIGDMAFNSFAYKAVSTFDGSTLNAEPLKVGITIQPPQPNILGNYVWSDLNNDGLQNDGVASGLNNIRIELYVSTDGIIGNGDDLPAVDRFGNDVSFTYSNNDANGNPGYYTFANLPNGNYYVKVITPTGFFITAANIGADDNIDNDYGADGMSPMVLLTGNNTTNNSVDAGITDTDCAIRAGADQVSSCITTFPGGSVTMAGLGAGVWTAAMSNPGTATITNPNANNTTITNFSLAGIYQFIFTSGDCIDTMQLTVVGTPSVFCDKVDNSNCAIPNGSATVSATGVTYMWSNGGTSASISGLSANTYSVTVTSTTSSCTNTCQVMVANTTINPNCNITINSQPSCANITGGSLSVVPSPAGSYTYAWSNGQTSATLTSLTGGNYTVTITDIVSGCTGVCNTTLDAPSLCCNINTVEVQNVTCHDNNTSNLITDNKIRFTANITNTNLSLSTYNLSINGGTTITPNTNVPYGLTQFTLGSGTAGGDATFTVTVTDSATPGCTQTFQIVDPGPCAQGTAGCPSVQCGIVTIQTNGN